MSRFPMRHAATRWMLAMIVIVGSIPVPRPIAADEVIIVLPPFVRKFPSGVFCPFPFELEFSASGATAKIFVSANSYVFDGNQPPGSEMVYAHQAIDNIAVVRDSIRALHSRDNSDPNSPFHDCYSCFPGDCNVPSIFLFDQMNPGDGYLEKFDSGSAAGWDVTNGAYYDNSRSGPTNPSAQSGFVTPGSGCLGLGEMSATPSLADTARTSIQVGSLIVGKRYVLTGWWSVDDGISTEHVSISITITGPDLVPLAQKTWGSLKARYR